MNGCHCLPFIISQTGMWVKVPPIHCGVLLVNMAVDPDERKRLAAEKYKEDSEYNPEHEQYLMIIDLVVVALIIGSVLKDIVIQPSIARNEWDILMWFIIFGIVGATWYIVRQIILYMSIRSGDKSFYLKGLTTLVIFVLAWSLPTVLIAMGSIILQQSVYGWISIVMMLGDIVLLVSLIYNLGRCLSYHREIEKRLLKSEYSKLCQKHKRTPQIQSSKNHRALNGGGVTQVQQ